MTAVDHESYVGKLALGRFRIVRLLAVGGMGAIYLARQEGAAGFTRPVVVKRVLPDLLGDESMLKMFVREAKIVASLRHPGIVAVSDFAREGNDYVMVMEYVDGYNLTRWLRYLRDVDRQFDPDVAIEIAIQVAEALHYAHSLNGPDGKPNPIYHRDVTPSNVLVDTTGHVQLVDFGIARSAREVTEPDAEGPKLKGKFPYLAPEMFTGAEPSPQTDVYALAMTLHEILVGKNEIVGADMRITVYRAVHHVPTRLDKIRPDIDAALADVVARALSKKPEERFATAADFAEALRRARRLDPDAARAALHDMAVKDLRDSDLAARQGIDDLATLDRAWRTYSPSKPPPNLSLPPGPRPKRERERTPPTVDASLLSVMAATRPEAPAPRRWLWGVAAGAVLLVAGGAAALALWPRPRNDAGPQYLFIQGNVTPGTGDEPATSNGPRDAASVGAHANPANTANALTGTDAGRPGPAVATTTAAGDAGRTTTAVDSHRAPRDAGSAPRDPTNALTRTFARQQGRVTRCFEQNSNEVAQTPEVSVRFEVDATGHVADARVIPDSLRPTSFGSCILGIARGVDFGPQSGRIAFRIPITVRRVQR